MEVGMEISGILLIPEPGASVAIYPLTGIHDGKV